MFGNLQVVKVKDVNSIGIVRKLDDRGRIVLPIELRTLFGIGENDGVEFFMDDGSVVLRKYRCVCVFCGSTYEIAEFKKRNVCKRCLTAMAENL